ncbi:MAG: recombinase family protein [Chloroflexi bacterium]|nr:recombinase family protein [Chloroflexota bacterium]
MTTKAKTIRAAAYIRVSTKRQVEKGASLDEQRIAIEAYCEAHGIELVKLYIDEGISGRKINRPAFQELLADVKAGLYQLIVVWKIDRISRRPIMGYRLKEAMDATKAEFYSIIEGDLVNNRMMFGIWLAWAEQESMDKSVRAKMGALARAKKGKVTNVVRYGYRKGEDGYPEVDEDEARIVRRIFNEYIEGVPTLQIIARLDRDGIETRHGKIWRPRSVTQIIAATEYIGIGHFNKIRNEPTSGDSKRAVRIDPKDWIEIAYPTILDKKQWEAAQEALKRNRGLKRPGKGYKLHYPLRHLLWCECGQRYTTHAVTTKLTRRRKDGTVTSKFRTNPGRVYACIVGRYKKDAGCVRRSIGAVKIEKAVWEVVKDVLEHPEMVMKLIDDRRRSIEETGSHAEMDRARNELEKVEEERQRALTVFQKGYLNEAELDIRMKSINERREMYREDLDRMESEVNDYERQVEMLNAFIERAEDIKKRLADPSDVFKSEVIAAMVKRVDVSEDIKVRLVVGSESIIKDVGRRSIDAQSSAVGLYLRRNMVACS